MSNFFKCNPLITAIIEHEIPGNQFMQTLKARSDERATELLKLSVSNPSFYTSILLGKEVFFTPTERAAQMYNWITGAIKTSYLHRDPTSPEFKKFINSLAVTDAGSDSYYLRSKTASNPQGKFPAATCKIICGDTGTGKSYSVETALSFIPQYIDHEQFDGMKRPFKQLPYIKFDSPRFGAINAMSLAFMYAVDQAIGSNYASQYSEVSRISTLKLAVQKLIAIYGIGLVVIDECQNLSPKDKSSSMEHSATANYFEQLINQSGISLMMITTPEGLPPLMTSSNLSGRISNSGIHHTFPMRPDSDEYQMLVDDFLLNYGLQIDSKESKEFRRRLHFYTGGYHRYLNNFFSQLSTSAQSKQKSTLDLLDLTIVQRINVKSMATFLASKYAQSKDDLQQYLDIPNAFDYLPTNFKTSRGGKQ